MTAKLGRPLKRDHRFEGSRRKLVGFAYGLAPEYLVWVKGSAPVGPTPERSLLGTSQQPGTAPSVTQQ